MPHEDEINESNARDFEKQSIEKFMSSYSALAKDTNETITPLIVARNDIAKVLITLSSAILALTITASSGIFEIYLHDARSIYLIATWLMLMLTVLLCLSSLWLSMNIVRTIIEFKNDVFDYINDIKSVLDKDKSELKKIIDKRALPFANMNKQNKWAHYFLQASLLSFFAALIIFFTIGWIAFSTSRGVTSP